MPGTGTGLKNTYLKMSRKYELKDKDKGPSFSTNVYYIFITFGKVKSVVSRNMAVREQIKKKECPFQIQSNCLETRICLWKDRGNMDSIARYVTNNQYSILTPHA